MSDNVESAEVGTSILEPKILAGIFIGSPAVYLRLDLTDAQISFVVDISGPPFHVYFAEGFGKDRIPCGTLDGDAIIGYRVSQEDRLEVLMSVSWTEVTIPDDQLIEVRQSFRQNLQQEFQDDSGVHVHFLGQIPPQLADQAKAVVDYLNTLQKLFDEEAAAADYAKAIHILSDANVAVVVQCPQT